MPLWSLFRPAFQFLEPGPLVDGTLELVEPNRRYVDDLLSACRHPTTLAEAPDMARVTRQGLNHFLDNTPFGHHPGHPNREPPPAYHFWMRLGERSDLPIRMAGGIGLRIGDTPNLRRYIGHVGYNVYPAARGHHLAERATRLLLPLARRHGLSSLWITCNPDNQPSHRTCQRLGATYVDTVDVPSNHPLYRRGEKKKCRYRLDL